MLFHNTSQHKQRVFQLKSPHDHRGNGRSESVPSALESPCVDPEVLYQCWRNRLDLNRKQFFGITCGAQLSKCMSTARMIIRFVEFIKKDCGSSNQKPALYMLGTGARHLIV
jgi:hypothetical protein